MQNTVSTPYQQPAWLEEAFALLERHPQAFVCILAGGTDLVVRLKQGLVNPAVLVDINRLGELREIRHSGRGLSLGATLTLAELARNQVISHGYRALAEAAVNSVGGPNHRRMGTPGGNLCLEIRCWYYNHSREWRGYRAACLKAGGEVCFEAKRWTACHAYFAGDVAPALLALEARGYASLCAGGKGHSPGCLLYRRRRETQYPKCW